MIDVRYTGGVRSTVKRVGNPLFIRDVTLYLSGIGWYITKSICALRDYLRP